jgi:hypothetical protein
MDVVPFHIGITTPDLARSMKALSSALGITWSAVGGGEGELPVVGGGFQTRPVSSVSKEGPIHIDLIKGAPGTIWDTESPGLHHFAYWTDALVDDVDRLTKEGWKLEMTFPDPAGRPTVFAYLVGEDGFRVELIDRSGRAEFMARLAQ